MDPIKKAILISFAGGCLCGFSAGFGVGYVYGSRPQQGTIRKTDSSPTAEAQLAYASAVLASVVIVPLLLLKQTHTSS